MGVWSKNFMGALMMDPSMLLCSEVAAASSTSMRLTSLARNSSEAHRFQAA